MTKRLIIKERGSYRILFLNGEYKTLSRAILAIKDHDKAPVGLSCKAWGVMSTPEKTFYRVEW